MVHNISWHPFFQSEMGVATIFSRVEWGWHLHRHCKDGTSTLHGMGMSTQPTPSQMRQASHLIIKWNMYVYKKMERWSHSIPVYNLQVLRTYYHEYGYFRLSVTQWKPLFFVCVWQCWVIGTLGFPMEAYWFVYVYLFEYPIDSPMGSCVCSVNPVLLFYGATVNVLWVPCQSLLASYWCAMDSLWKPIDFCYHMDLL